MGIHLDPEDFIRLQNNDDSAWHKLYNVYKDRLYIRAYQLVQHQAQAEDITVETITKLWRERQKLTSIGDVVPFLYTILHSKCLDYLKSPDRNKELGSFSDPEQLADELPAPESLDIYTSIRVRVAHLVIRGITLNIDNLPPRGREIFQLYFIEGWSRTEIAEQLGISVNTVDNHWDAVKKKLRNELLKKGILLLFIAFYIYYLLF